MYNLCCLILQHAKKTNNNNKKPHNLNNFYRHNIYILVTIQGMMLKLRKQSPSISRLELLIFWSSINIVTVHQGTNETKSRSQQQNICQVPKSANRNTQGRGMSQIIPAIHSTLFFVTQATYICLLFPAASASESLEPLCSVCSTTRYTEVQVGDRYLIRIIYHKPSLEVWWMNQDFPTKWKGERQLPKCWALGSII